MSIEKEREKLQIYLDSEKSAKERNRLGQFSTPYKVACSIISYVRGVANIPSSVRFLEPSIGTGVFFSAFRSQANIKEAIGYEIDPHYSLPAQKLWENEPLSIITADFLDVKPQKRFNLILANPPYSRHHHIDSCRKKELSKRIWDSYRISISGLSGLYCYFLILSTLWLEEDGISVWLIPSEFMDVNYGSCIREFLTSKVDLIAVHKFNEKNLQFQDALVSSCVVIFKNRKISNDKVRLTSGADISCPQISIDISKVQLSKNNKWSNFFDVRDSLQRSDSVQGIRYFPISRYFNVSRGISTGNNSFFILNNDSSEVRDFPKEFLHRILPSPRYMHTNEVNDIELNEYCQYLFNCTLPIEILERNYPNVAQYIHNAEEKERNARYNCARRTPWYSTEKRDTAPFFLTYMGRGDNYRRIFRFILNNTDVIVTNSYLMLYPKEEYKKDFENAEIRRRVWTVLSSIPMADIVKCGRCYGGGLYKIEPKELLNVRIPSIDHLLMNVPKSLFDC